MDTSIASRVRTAFLNEATQSHWYSQWNGISDPLPPTNVPVQNTIEGLTNSACLHSNLLHAVYAEFHKTL